MNTTQTYEIFESGGYYMCYYRDQDGKRKRVKRRSRQDLEKWIAEQARVQADDPTIQELFRRWNDRRLHTGQVCGATHLRDRRYYERYYGGSVMSGRRIRAAGPDLWTDFMQGRFESGMTAKQWAGFRGITRGMLKYAHRQKLIAWTYEQVIADLDIYVKGFRQRERPDDGEEILYPEELEELREYCLKDWGPHERCIWLISYTGLRIGEAVALTADDIDLDRKILTVRKRETRGDASGRPVVLIRPGAKTAAGMRDIALPASIIDLVGAIAEMHGAGGYLFCSPRDGHRLSGEAVRRRLEKIEADMRIPKRPPHKLRKTVASILCDSGTLTDKQIIRQMGHTDIQVTHGFYSRDRTTADERAALLDTIPEMGKKKEHQTDDAAPGALSVITDL